MRLKLRRHKKREHRSLDFERAISKANGDPEALKNLRELSKRLVIAVDAAHNVCQICCQCHEERVDELHVTKCGCGEFRVYFQCSHDIRGIDGDGDRDEMETDDVGECDLCGLLLHGDCKKGTCERCDQVIRKWHVAPPGEVML